MTFGVVVAHYARFDFAGDDNLRIRDFKVGRIADGIKFEFHTFFSALDKLNNPGRSVFSQFMQTRSRCQQALAITVFVQFPISTLINVGGGP